LKILMFKQFYRNNETEKNTWNSYKCQVAKKKLYI